MNYETSKEIEIAISKKFGIRKYIMCPNLSWGLLKYECDIAILTKNGYLYEVEIKVSANDLKQDKLKRKWKYEDRRAMIRKMWFAIPEKLLPYIEHIPDVAGIFIVHQNGRVIEHRKSVQNRGAIKLTDKQQYQIVRLTAMRIWKLKEVILNRDLFNSK